jgi:hypothetical protein
MLARVRDGKLYALYEAGAAVPAFTGKIFRIGLKLLNPYFSNFTELPFSLGSPVPLYTNAVSPGSFGAFEKVALVGRIFSHSVSSADRPAVLTLKNAVGQILQTDTLTAPSDQAAASYDLSGQAAGACEVKETYPGTVKKFAYYCDAELQKSCVFAILEIRIDVGFYSAAPTFEIPFNAKKEILKYYVVAKNYSDTEFNHLSVVDNGATEDQRQKVNFTKAVSSAFTSEDISPVLLGSGDSKVVLFKSQTPMARQEKARRKIQLSKNGEVLITHLPQPGADKTDANIIIHISKP